MSVADHIEMGKELEKLHWKIRNVKNPKKFFRLKKELKSFSNCNGVWFFQPGWRELWEKDMDVISKKIEEEKIKVFGKLVNDSVARNHPHFLEETKQN
jgi:hypothetical protein